MGIPFRDIHFLTCSLLPRKAWMAGLRESGGSLWPLTQSLSCWIVTPMARAARVLVTFPFIAPEAKLGGQIEEVGWLPWLGICGGGGERWHGLGPGQGEYG